MAADQEGNQRRNKGDREDEGGNERQHDGDRHRREGLAFDAGEHEPAREGQEAARLTEHRRFAHLLRGMHRHFEPFSEPYQPYFILLATRQTPQTYPHYHSRPIPDLLASSSNWDICFPYL